MRFIFKKGKIHNRSFSSWNVIVFNGLVIIALLFCGCSTFNQTTSRSNIGKIAATNKFENKDFSNKPVNLNDEKDRKQFEILINELRRNRNLWVEKKVTNYDYLCEHFQEGIGSDFNLTFKVRDGKPLPIDKDFQPYQYEYADTIEELFDIIQKSLEEGYRVNVKYNKEYGYPLEIGTLGTGNAWASTKIKRFEIVQ